MSRLSAYLCIANCILFLSSAHAEDAFTPKEIILAPKIESTMIQENKNVVKEETIIPVQAQVVKKKTFSPFTGKIKGNKVRVRLQPDLECQVVKELVKHDLVSVIDEEGDFWAIQAPEGVKAYVFRSFVLDNTVEGNRVNIRLQPSLDAPIIGHLNSGDKIKGSVSSLNNKWLEIPTPTQAKFYVAKDFVEFAGGPDLKAQLDKRKNTLEQLFESSSLLCKVEMQKSFEEIDFERLKRSFTTIIQDATDFPQYAEKAKESLAALQDAYLQKRIAYLETKAEADSAKKHAESLVLENLHVQPAVEASDRMKMWEPLEEALYNSWAHLNEEKNQEDFYNDQRLVAVPIKGFLEAYVAPVKNKPGDYILKDKDLPVAYVYSTKIDLKDFIGKKVTLLGTPRPNNNFAFPAYFVHAVDN